MVANLFLIFGLTLLTCFLSVAVAFGWDRVAFQWKLKRMEHRYATPYERHIKRQERRGRPTLPKSIHYELPHYNELHPSEEEAIAKARKHFRN